MKIIFRLIVILFPLIFLGQEGELPNKEPRRPSPPISEPKTSQQKVSSPTSALEIQGNRLVSLDPACNACKGAPITLQVHNKSSRKLPLYFSTGEVTSTPSGKDFNAKILFVPLEGEDDHENSKKTTVAAGETFKLRASVVGTLNQGTWEITLLNQGKPFGKFKVLNSPVTFNVKPDVADATNVELKFTRGERTGITIKNEDAISYMVECFYTIGAVSAPCKLGNTEKPDQQIEQPNDFKTSPKGSTAVHVVPHPATKAEQENPSNQQTAGSNDFKVSSKGSTVVYVDPDRQWFEHAQAQGQWDKAGAWLHVLRGLISDSRGDGQLTIRLRSNNCGSDLAAPVKIFKFKSSLFGYSDETRQISGFVIVFLVLFAGAMLSVLANLLLPGAARRLKVKEELAVVSRKVSDLSMDLDSRVRVPLGVERARLSTRLEELGTVSPDFSTAIAEIEKDVAGQKIRLDVLEKMELVVRRYWKMRREGRLPMSLTQEIDDIRQQATDVLARSEPKDADLQNAQLLIQEIEKRISNIDQANPALAQQLVGRFQKLQDDMGDRVIANSPTLQKLQSALPELFLKLKAVLPKAEDIRPPDYVELDTTVSQLEIVNRYNALEKNPVDDNQRNRLGAYRNKLLALLRQTGWDALNQARSLIQQLEENVLPEDVAKAVEDKQVEIEADRNLIYQFESVGFRLLFLNKAISASTARREFTTKWDFGDNLTERGGWVSHYFTNPTMLSNVMPWSQAIGRLSIGFITAYLIIGLPVAWFVEGMEVSRWVLVLAGLISLALAVVVIPFTPLGREFWLAIKKTWNSNLGKRETDPQYLRPPYTLTAFLTQPDGAPLPHTVDKALEVYKTARTRLPASFWVEATRFAITLLIVLVGLVTGAKEQLLKLDVFPALAAIFMIGFGANEVKKLFTQNPQG
ncbi:MAG TPA: hypothetical protein VIK39_07270 [Candidatus Angelobacter sp.]